MKIPTTLIPCRAEVFAIALLMTYGVSAVHELLHHVTGALMCAPGRMSLDLFVQGAGCEVSILVSAIGPLLNYVLLWLGAWMLYRGRHSLLALGLITASVPLVRYVGIVMGGNDEGVIARALFDPGMARVIAPLVAGLLILPPILLAAKAIANQWRWAWWTAMMIGPLLLLLPKRWLDQQMFAGWMRDPAVLLPEVGGVPVSVLLIHALVMATLLLVIWWSRTRQAANSQPQTAT